MSRRLGIVVVAVVGAAFFLMLSGGGSEPGESTLAPRLSIAAEGSTTTSELRATDAPVGDGSVLRLLAEEVVGQYWEHLSDDASLVATLFDLPPDQLTREMGLAEYSAAYGGRYQADCEAGVIVQDEVIVDCLVEVVDDPLIAAFAIGPTPSQFRVRDGKITRVGYLKPFSTVDLALSAYAVRTDPVDFERACSDPGGIYLSDAGVVYNSACGAYLADLVDGVLAELRSDQVCGDDCDAALLRAIRPSRD